MGYHVAKIPRGEFGEVSKIEEELAEFKDALDQGNSIMALVELSDMVGAIEGWLRKHHLNITLEDLCTMKEATHRAFNDGTRKARPADRPTDKPTGVKCWHCGGDNCGPYRCNDCKAT